MLKQILSTLLFLFLFVPAIVAQTGGIEGTATDEVTGEPIPGANALIVGTSQGAATTVDGHYATENVEPGTYTLRINFIGYKEANVQGERQAGETLEKVVAVVPA